MMRFQFYRSGIFKACRRGFATADAEVKVKPSNTGSEHSHRQQSRRNTTGFVSSHAGNSLPKLHGNKLLRRANPIPEPRPEFHPIKAFCTASEYDFGRLSNFLRRNYYVVSPPYCDEILHIKYKSPFFNLVSPGEQPSSSSNFSHPAFNSNQADNGNADSFTLGNNGETVVNNPGSTFNGSDCGEVFYHKNGCVVMWNIGEKDVKKILYEVKAFEIDSEGEMETEELDFIISENIEQVDIYLLKQYVMFVCRKATVNGDVVLLPKDRDAYELFRDKLAVSHGMANCVKLGVLEKKLEAHFESVKHIPNFMLAGKSVPISRTEAYSMIGELISFRAQLNLHSEIIDTPDIYWSEPRLEEIYNKITRVLELKHRVAVINRKLDYANEFSNIIRNHLSEKHSIKLEWFIIILISVEVVYGSLHFFEIGYSDIRNWVSSLFYPSAAAAVTSAVDVPVDAKNIGHYLIKRNFYNTT